LHKYLFFKVFFKYIFNSPPIIGGSFIPIIGGGIWDGNDVYWLNIDKCSISTDFDDASIFGHSVAKKLDSSYVVIPFCVAEKS